MKIIQQGEVGPVKLWMRCEECSTTFWAEEEDVTRGGGHHYPTYYEVRCPGCDRPIKTNKLKYHQKCAINKRLDKVSNQDMVKGLAVFVISGVTTYVLYQTVKSFIVLFGG